MAVSGNISQVTLPNGDTYLFKDQTARDTMELEANKVTALSSASTDIEYPSAKAVYDAIVAASAAIEYVCTDSSSNGNVVITAMVVGSLDSSSY